MMARLVSVLADAFSGGNPLLFAVVSLLSLWSVALGLVEFLAEQRPKKRLCEAAVFTIALLVLCLTMPLLPALLVLSVSLLLFLWIVSIMRSQKRAEEVAETLNLPQKCLPVSSEVTTSVEFRRAAACIEEKRPQEALAHLRKCRGKIAGQMRYMLLYADALILLENPKGACSKLEDIPDGRLRSKSNFINVTLRKAGCYRALHDYENEVTCYDALLARGIDPGRTYLWRAQVKQRMLEIYECLPSMEHAVGKTDEARRVFLQGIFADLERAGQYTHGNDSLTEGKLMSHRAACCILNGDISQGRALLDEAKKKNDVYTNTLLYDGICLSREKKYDQAVGALRKAVCCLQQNEAQQTDEEKDRVFMDTAFYELVKLHFKRLQLDEAMRCAAQALSLFPRRSDCFELQGQCYQMKRMYSEAIVCYTKALELKPDADLYAERAKCFFNRSNRESALAYRDMQQALQMEPDNHRYRLDALLYRSAMDHRTSTSMNRDELTEQTAPFAEDPKSFGNLGVIYNNYGYLEESEAYYRKAIEDSPQNDSIHYNLATLFVQQSRYTEAVEELKQAIDLMSGNMQYYRLLIECYQKIDDTENEIATQCRLTALRTKYAAVNRMNGDAVYKLGKYQKAGEYYRAALEYSEDPIVLNNLACVCYAKERYEQAAAYLKQAIGQDKQYALAYFNQGNCQLRMGVNGAAKESYEASLRLAPGLTCAAQILDSMQPQDIRMQLDTTLPQKKTGKEPVTLRELIFW